MSAAKFKVDVAVVGKIAANKGWQGTIIAIVPTEKAPRYKIRWQHHGEQVVTARAICLPHELAAVQPAQLQVQGAQALAGGESEEENESGIESNDDDEDEDADSKEE